MSQGWIQLHRKSLDNPLFKDPDSWHYWEYCLLKACHDHKKIIWNKKELIIERGSFITGRKKAAKETGLSESKVRRAQETLINLEMIKKVASKSTSKFTYITVCNYKHYQQGKKQSHQQIPPAGDQQATSKPPAGDQQATTYNNINNLNNENNVNNENKEIPPNPQGGNLSNSEDQKLPDLELQPEEKPKPKNSRKKKSVVKHEISPDREEKWKEFWKDYPRRNGIKGDRNITIGRFNDLDINELPDVMTGIKNYIEFLKLSDQYPKDAQSWLFKRQWLVYLDWEKPEAPEPEKTPDKKKGVDNQKTIDWMNKQKAKQEKNA